MKKEPLEVLKNRRSIRQFKSEQVSKEDLDIILEAGTYAPTAANTQQPVIVAVQNPEDVAKLDELNAIVMNNPSCPHPYYGAPTILLVLEPEDVMKPRIDCALIGGNLLNAAYAVGVGSCWIDRSAQVFQSPEGKALLKKWGLPETMRGVCSIALGYADCQQPEAAPRKADYIV